MKSNLVSILFVSILVALGVYWYFFTGTGNQPPLSASEPENQAQVTFQNLADELQPISFDTSIFSDARFNALVDLSTSITPESTGRLDPFAPIAGISGD